jgi:cell division septal protein FtsQ
VTASPPTTGQPTPEPEPTPKALSIRWALILIMAFVAAGVAGILFWLGTSSIPLAILTGATAFGAAWAFFDRVIS